MGHRLEPASASAEELQAKALDLLDFPAIRERVAGYTQFFAARELALHLRPSYDSRDVEGLQRETAEGRAFLEEHGDISLHATEDPSPAISRAALEGALTGLELLAVARLMEVLRTASSALSRVQGTLPLLYEMAKQIPDVRELQREITASIGDQGEVLDAATPALGPLRLQVREAYQRVTEALERVINSATGREALQDQVISIRGDRLVVQVKTEMRHRVPGIVHDASNTGATLFIEPLSTVDLCNDWRELALEEQREAARVLRELSEMVGAADDDLNRGIEVTARLDLVMARARYARSLNGATAISSGHLQGQQPDGQQARLRLLKARHPLLGDGAVPISITMGPDWSVLVITGPNTGGKTVAMKTVGLLALMHQSGLQVPADDGSYLPVFDGVYADVGDQQSIHQSVSTFGSHMRNVIDILQHVGTGSLVLLDELGTSTDPEEGSALAKAILEHLAQRGVATVSTTHHRTVAAYAESTTGITNASVDLDPSTLRPTYLLTMGLPGRSYAMSVSAQLGLPADIMEAAQSLLEPQHRRFEDWLNELQNDRRLLQSRLQEADAALAKAETASREHEAQLEELRSRREDILHEIRSDLARQYDTVRKKIRRAESALSWHVSPGNVEAARTDLAEAREEMRVLERREPSRSRSQEGQPLAVGDTVDVSGLGVRAKVIEISDQGAEAKVAIGNIRLSLGLNRLSRAEAEEEPEAAPAEMAFDLGPSLTTVELDLRGTRAEAALIRLEEFLDKALRDGLSTVRIIHGHGTGALRQAVRDLLEGHPLAKSFAPEPPERGGDGATVVELT